jgi:hypothetical protein
MNVDVLDKTAGSRPNVTKVGSSSKPMLGEETKRGRKELEDD